MSFHPAEPASLHERLKAQTREAHSALERALPIAAGEPGLDVYRDHLQYLAGFHDPIETRLRAVDDIRQWLPDLDRRWKTGALRADLGLHDDIAVAETRMLPAVESTFSALGVLYVLEGATLGARTLLPRLRRAGLVPGEIGSRYLDGYGKHTGSMWQTMLETLGRVPAQASAAVIDSAVETFDSLHRWRRAWESLS